MSSSRSILCTAYINEILALSECSLSLVQEGVSEKSTKSSNLKENEKDTKKEKNIASKKSGLVYINSVFRSKNSDKIRACFDFKVHRFIVKFLTNNDPLLKFEALSIFKEISLGLVDMDELSWLFGNSYSKIFAATVKSTSDQIDSNELNESSKYTYIIYLIYLKYLI